MKLFNTLTKKVEDFKPINDKKVDFFVCGVTTYDMPHLGHAKTYIQMDLLARVLYELGFDVFYLQNITDIDDKIITRANEQNVGWREISKKYEKIYLEDMKSLNVTSITKYARATDYIDQIISQIKRLMESGHAYKIEDDGIYFEISTYPEYGKLSGRTEIRENDAESRIDKSDKKRGWNDFCVWKFSKPGEPVWNAPFGQGRPGWHIEDTAITEANFGSQYDIHGGAIDLIFPHHEAEITQMESLSGKKPFVRFWAHTGFLNVKGVRMGKSKGNFTTIRETLERGYDPLAIRLFMLQSHYRSPVDFSWEALDAAQTRLKTFRSMADQMWQGSDDARVGDKDIKRAMDDIIQALANDLNTPDALAALSNLETKLGRDGLNTKSKDVFHEFLDFLDRLFGLDLALRKDISNEQKVIIKDREDARLSQNWQKSDELREKLAKQGVSIKDTNRGPIWTKL